MNPTHPALSTLESPKGDASEREAEARTRLLVKASNIGLWDWDLVSNSVFFSPEWKSQLGYKDHEVPNRFEEWENRVHPDDIAPALAKLQEFLRGNQTEYEVELRLRHRDGSWRWILARSEVLRDAAGRPLSMMGCHIDITDRKRAEEEVRESRGRLKGIVDSAMDAIISINASRQIVLFNAAAEEMFGYRAADILGKSLEILLPAKFASEHARHVSGFMSSGVTTRKMGALGAVSGVRASGEKFPIEASISQVEIGSEKLCTVILRDITSRKAAEDALRELPYRLLQAEDLERRRIAKELHDSTAQDLVAVMLNLEVLRDALAPGDQKSEELLADSLALLENSASEIRTLSYIVHPPRLDETGLVGALEEYAAGFTRRTDVRVRFEAEAGFARLPEEVELALFRVVQESLANVLRHSGSDTADVMLSRQGQNVLLEVIDRGNGLPKEIREKHRGARGVGIVAMRERIQQFGGTLDLHSTEEGTTVSAMLPLPAFFV